MFGPRSSISPVRGAMRASVSAAGRPMEPGAASASARVWQIAIGPLSVAP
jgi:hypothetical protein